uniref:Uncharacterized protein n=1 Tax=Setaria viridis TaxID=4556 RepID=A0A4U6W1P6_SETVI|nr:hypothetical protein SEVIR_2G378800v2 [Setaria viridis]
MDEVEAPSMHFKSSNCGHNNSTVWHQSTVPTLYIHELLSSDISSKTCLRNNKATLPNQLQSNLISNN